VPIVVVVKCDPPPPAVWEGRCQHCRSRLQCFETDLRVLTHNGSWGGDPTPLASRPRVADCPVCHHKNVEFEKTDRTEPMAPDPKFQAAKKKKGALPRKK